MTSCWSENDIFIMTSFDYKYQNPAVFCFLMLIKTIVIYSLCLNWLLLERILQNKVGHLKIFTQQGTVLQSLIKLILD